MTTDGEVHGTTSAKPDRLILVVIALVILVLLAQGGVAAFYNNKDKVLLLAEFSKQESAIKDIASAKKQLDSIAGKTALLASQGNENAAKVVQRFKAAGIEIKIAQ